MTYDDRDPYGMYNHEAGKGPGPEQMGIDTLLGSDVWNDNNEELGDIKEMMLDMRTGKVSYAVLSHDSFLGMGEKLFAVPWSALTLDTFNKRFILKVDKARFKEAPGFEPDRWPDMADPAWRNEIHAFYGTQVDQDERAA